VALIWVLEITVKVSADAPLKLTEVTPVKFAPIIVTTVPTAPSAGEKLVITGAGIRVKIAVLMAEPLGVATVIGPVVALTGTVAITRVSDVALKVDASTPLKATALMLVKPVPVIITVAPAGALVGEKPVTVGGGTVNEVELETMPPGVVTLMGPVTAPTGTVALI
jgi:hypothetical protein